MITALDNTADVIDSRDVIARIDKLKEEWRDATEGDEPDDYALSEDDWSVGLGWDGAAEIVALLDLAEQGEQLADWEYGETLIRDSYFEQYARDVADDLIEEGQDMSWPFTYIDWERAADALQMDYTPVEFDGVTYWARA